MQEAQPIQPWKAMMARLENSNQEVKAIADTDTFKKGKAIVIGGQSRWGKKEDGAPEPSAKGLWYDTEDKSM